MFTFYDHDGNGSRRSFLRVGASSLVASLGLSGLPLVKALTEPDSPLLKGRSVIFLFLHGGPSQIETFDPKMDMPEGIRSATGSVRTKTPGIDFGGSFSKLAAISDRFSIVRSFATGDGNHDIKPIVGRDTFGANLGSIFARLSGTNHPVTGIPTNIMLFPQSVDPSTQAGEMTFGKFTATGPLNPSFAPFDPAGSGGDLRQLTNNVPRARLESRRLMSLEFDKIKHSLDSISGDNPFRDQAFRLLSGGLEEAFDIRRESPHLVDRYDTAPLVRPDSINKKWNNHKNYADNAKSLGKLLLLARRLCERGAGFVTVTTNFVWDMHADINNATMTEGMSYMGGPLDYALSALVEDLDARGLSDKVLVVACGEMGRTPKINANGGRDHWGGLAPLFIYGGGTNPGQVIGRSAKDAGSPADTPVGIKDLIATILERTVDTGQVRLIQNLQPEFSQIMTTWKPIPGLV
ncbi:MAG: DUF1501 domain-containing protein [Planctomycetota bacterium]